MENKVANALSRQQAEVLQVPVLRSIIEALKVDRSSKLGYVLKGGVLFYKIRLVLPAKSPITPLLLMDFHASPSGGHSGFVKAYRRITDNLFWH